MEKTCCAATGSPVARITPVALALAVMLATGSPADAASIGHSRLVSAPGQPLQINLPIRELSQAEQQSLRVSAAPLAAWQQAGLTPPVELSTLQVSIEEGFSADSRLIQVRSSQPFNGVVADLLLQINTAAGSQQHQVSLLANAPGSVPAGAGQAGASGTSSPAVGLGAPAPSNSISVRRGDTLFALARANAVDGVSVYQMMVALQKANPQAFIDGNINLVKAGATLSIPDAAALRAVSDREARRIFQQHAQAFAAYRQRVADQRGEVVTGGSTQSGAVSSAPATVSATPTAASGDQVVLSSGSADDARDDQRDATQRNIAESETRVSQLERNVQSLNQALQMQGEAAKDAVLDGAAAVGQTLSEAATSIGLDSEESTSAQDGAQNGSSAATGTDVSSPRGTASSATEQAVQAAQGAGAVATSGQTSQNTGSASPDSQQDGGTAGPTAASDSQQGGPAAGSAAAGTQQGGGGAGSVASGSRQGAGSVGPTDAAQAEDGAVNTSTAPVQPGASAAEESNTSTTSKAEQPVSWLQQNLLGVITAILALIVLVIAWVLRRASASRGGDGQGVVTEAMVQERLDKIDLDLSRSPNDGRPPHSG